MNDMTRTDAVMAVMQVFDRLESAERKADQAACMLGNTALAGQEGYRTEAEAMLDAAVTKAGRKVVLEKHLYSWNQASASRDEDSGIVNATSYEKWIKEKVKNIPDYASRESFLAYFEVDLRELYEAEKAEAIAELED